MAKNMVVKVEYPTVNVKVVTYSNGETITLYWSQTMQQWVTIPA